jgi:thiosulfate dehydrogenase [quinone] large subunit
MSRTETPVRQPVDRRRTNGWPVLPLRIFLAALFMFAGYAKLSYPGFFDPKSFAGLKASVDAVKHGTPVGGLLGPLSDHPSLFGHITAYAEIAIGLGLLVGLLTRIAAAGGIVLTVLIVLSIDWGGVKEYTGSSGWFTSVDLAVAAALSVFVLGGADALSLDNLLWRRRLRHAARDDGEPGFRDNELDDSRRRLQGDHPTGEYPTAGADQPTTGYPAVSNEQRTEQLPEPEPHSLWNAGRREPEGSGEQDRN